MSNQPPISPKDPNKVMKNKYFDKMFKLLAHKMDGIWLFLMSSDKGRIIMKEKFFKQERAREELQKAAAEKRAEKLKGKKK